MYRYVNAEVLVRRGVIIRVAVNARSLEISNFSGFFLGRRETVWCVGGKTTGTRKTEGESIAGERRLREAS